MYKILFQQRFDDFGSIDEIQRRSRAAYTSVL